MKRLFPFAFFFILITTGCYSIETVESTTVSSNDVYQYYSIKTDKNRTSVSAVFRVGEKSGATIDLDAPSKIEHNGKLVPEIAPNGWKGTTYDNSENKFVGNHQFIYTDATGKTFRNEVNFAPLEFSENSFKVSRLNNNLIPLSRAVDKNEEVSAYISGRIKPGKTDSTTNSHSSVSVRLNSARSAVLIEPSDLKSLLDGRASLNLRFEKTQPLQQGSAKGGEIKIYYEAQAVKLNIVN